MLVPPASMDERWALPGPGFIRADDVRALFSAGVLHIDCHADEEDRCTAAVSPCDGDYGNLKYIPPCFHSIVD